MKTIICGMIVMINSFLHAQCDNQVRTNPSNPNNLALPDINNELNSPDNRFKNGFNWWADGFYQLTSMQYNPTQPYVDISNIQDPNCIPYYHYLVEALGAEEMNPQNGWELLLVNLGRYPDNLTVAPTSTLREIPYIGLYNRYTGKLRIFVQYGYNQPAVAAVDGLKISIFYSTLGNPINKSTILRLGGGIDKSLDQLNPSPFLTAVCPPNGSAVSQWMSADFQLTYDPCVCNFPTDLSVSFNFFSETDFRLTGRSISLVDDLVNNGQITNQNFLSSVSADNKNGYIIYEKMGSLADEYISDMGAYKLKLAAVGEYNEQVDKKLLAIKIFKQVVNIGLLAATGTADFSQFALAWPAINFKTIINGQTVIDAAKSEAFYGKVEEILGENLNTFISESLKKKDDPIKPIMPTVTLTEMQFAGTLTDEFFAPSILFSTPGSFTNSPTVNNLPVNGAPQSYPVYNQPLGVFALLETPKVKQSKASKVSTIACESIYEQNPLDLFNDIYVGLKSFRNTENRSQFKLNSPLVYTFNPGLDYKTKKVSAMYIIKTKVKENNRGVGNNSESTAYKSKIYDASINLYSSTINTYKNELIWDYQNVTNFLTFGQILSKKDSLIYNSEFIPIDAFNNFIVEVATFENDEQMTYTSCTSSTGLLVNGFNQDVWENFDVQIKLKVDVEFNSTHSNGDPHAYSYVFTYNIADGDLIPVSSPFLPNISGSNADFLQYPSNLSFGATTFNGAIINGCELVGNTYTCQAWDKIEINGTINVSSPYDVNFIAGNQIDILPEAIVSPQTSFFIQQLLDYSNPMPEVSSTYVSGFCGGTNIGLPSYKGNIPGKSPNQEYSNQGEIANILEASWTFNLYPNPTSTFSTVQVNNYENNGFDVFVFDMSGKIVLEDKSKENKFILNTSLIEKGIYLVKISTLQGSKIKRLVIQ